MTAIQLQRIIGVVLLFSLIVGIAILLIRSADDGVAIDNTQPMSTLGIEPQVADVVEPYITEAIINPVSDAQQSVISPLEQTAVEQKAVEAKLAPVEPVVESIVKPAPVVPIEVKPVPVKPVTAAVKPPVIKPAPIATKPIPAAVPAVTAEKWIVQLASFSVKANADALNSQAKQMGYKSVIENSDSANGKVYRVRLEPVADKQKAQAVASDINKKLKLSPQVFQE